jgi:hypothetical protein
MGNSLKQSQSVNAANRKALRHAVKHKAKVTVIRRIAKPVRAFPRRQG